MKAFDFPTKKNFEQDFIFNGKVFFTLKYTQATLQEFFDFYALSPENQYLELREIVESQISYSFWQRVLKKVLRGYKTKFEIAIDIDNIIQNVQKNRFRIYDSIFTELDIKKAKGKSKAKS